MKKLCAMGVVGLILLPLPCAHTQTPSAAELRALAAEAEAKKEELVNLEKETARALQWNSGTFFRRAYGEDFQGILPNGQILDRTMYIAMMENSGSIYTSFVVSDIRVRMYEETAVVTCLWSARGTKGGQPFARQSRVTHVYLYGQRGWQAVASQETLLPG